MARGLTVRKKKKVSLTKTQAGLINAKYFGEEPVLKEGYSQSDYIGALNWYTYMCSSTEARKFIEEFLKETDLNTELRKFKKVPDVWVPNTAAWVARMLSRGMPLADSSFEYMMEEIKKSFNKIPSNENTKKEKKPLAPVISIQDRMREKANDIIGEIESIVDDRENQPEFSLYNWLKEQDIPAAYAKHIVDFYTPVMIEYLEVEEGKDKDLNEAYAYLKKRQLAKEIKFFMMLVDDATRYGEVTKKVRKPRKPKSIPVAKKIKSLKYQKEDTNYKIASVNPEKIIGAKELWTFNTKYKVLTVFRALNREGLQVKGTSIINYDESNSHTKRTGRKPEYFVDRALNGGKIVLRKLMDEMDKETALAHRINDNTILLRVM